MPLHIIRQDITKIKCDAIVNPANSTLLGGGGADGAIHKVAGKELLEECKTLGGCPCGDAKITKGYNLPCKYVIHTVGPIWQGGVCNERALLESCYKKSLDLAKAHGVETIAFPLISSGAYGYPKDKALSVAVQTISEFLFHNEMTVYIAVFDKKSFEIGKTLYENVLEYIDDNYVDETAIEPRSRCVDNDYDCKSVPIFDEIGSLPAPDAFEEKSYSVKQCKSKRIAINKLSTNADSSLDVLLKQLSDNFAVSLLKLIDEKGYTDVECYKKANVSKQTWYKIMNDKNYKPSKNTVLCFAIALKLSFEETQTLLATVGFTLSKSNKFDLIIEYFLINGEYDIFLINETLFKFDQPCLGV